MTHARWGAAASFVLAVAYVIPSLAYLTGDLASARGPATYGAADFLYGPGGQAAALSDG